jgi:hypothetical protein
MATYTKNMIKRALSFWKTKLNESNDDLKNTMESEEDQKKEAAEKQAEEEQADIDSAEDSEMSFDPDVDFSMNTGDDDMSSDGEEDSNEEFVPDSDEEDEDSDEEDEDSDEEDEDSDDEDEDSDDEDEDSDEEDEDSDDEEFKLEIETPSEKFLTAIPELCKKFGSRVSITVIGQDVEEDSEESGYTAEIKCLDEETLNEIKEEQSVKDAVGGTDKEMNESLKYEPNTVGAVIKLLSKSDPRDFLFIRQAPNMNQCMIYDIDRSVIVEGQSTTYLDIVKGNPNE